jgi:LEA14-like dessication related protein
MEKSKLFLPILYLGVSVLFYSCAGAPKAKVKPQVSLKEISLADATLSDSTMIFRISVENQNEESQKIEEVSYVIKFNGKHYSSGTIDTNIRVRPGSTAEIEIPLKVNIVEVFDSEILAMNKKVADYHLSAVVQSGAFRVPLNSQGTTAVLP